MHTPDPAGGGLAHIAAAQLLAELEEAAIDAGRDPADIRLSALASEGQVDSFILWGTCGRARSPHPRRAPAVSAIDRELIGRLRVGATCGL